MQFGDPKNEFNISDIPGWVHACWVSLVALVWKGKPIAKGIIGIASVGVRMDQTEERLLKIEQVQVSKLDIDNLRNEFQETTRSNHLDLKSDLRLMFTDFRADLKEDIYRRYDTLDGMIGRIKKAQDGTDDKTD
jgi:hypothetical protein